jgi:hypothetical protein
MRLSASAREIESTKTKTAEAPRHVSRPVERYRRTGRGITARCDTSLLSVTIQRADFIDSLRTRHGDPDTLVLCPKAAVVGPFRASFVALQTQPLASFLAARFK